MSKITMTLEVEAEQATYIAMLIELWEEGRNLDCIRTLRFLPELLFELAYQIYDAGYATPKDITSLAEDQKWTNRERGYVSALLIATNYMREDQKEEAIADVDISAEKESKSNAPTIDDILWAYHARFPSGMYTRILHALSRNLDIHSPAQPFLIRLKKTTGDAPNGHINETLWGLKGIGPKGIETLRSALREVLERT